MSGTPPIMTAVNVWDIPELIKALKEESEAGIVRTRQELIYLLEKQELLKREIHVASLAILKAKKASRDFSVELKKHGR